MRCSRFPDMFVVEHPELGKPKMDPNRTVMHESMLLSPNLTRETHYEVLSVEEDASLDEIRSGYRLAILKSHPDKIGCLSGPTTSGSHATAGDKFLRIQKAWETLSDPKSRAIYDNELRSSRSDSITADEINMDDMSVDDSGESLVLYHRCRCGDCFSIDSLELSNIGCVVTKDGPELRVRAPESLSASVVLPCGSCSLRIRLLIDSDATIPLYDQL